MKGDRAPVAAPDDCSLLKDDVSWLAQARL
jgi:hypothetical protein